MGGVCYSVSGGGGMWAGCVTVCRAEGGRWRGV